MHLTDKLFKGLYRRGVMLEQMKEPALSRTVKQLLPVEPCENPRNCEGLSAEEILLAAQQADIVDETDGRPLAEKLREVFGGLDRREQTVLRLRYGLCNRLPMTQREVAGRLGISRSYVSRLEKHAIERLRAEMTGEGLPRAAK